MLGAQGEPVFTTKNGSGTTAWAAPTRSPRPGAWPANGWRNISSDGCLTKLNFRFGSSLCRNAAFVSLDGMASEVGGISGRFFPFWLWVTGYRPTSRIFGSLCRFGGKQKRARLCPHCRHQRADPHDVHDPFAASGRPTPANTATKKADTEKQRQNRSTSPFAHGASDTRTISRRFDTGCAINGSSPCRWSNPSSARSLCHLPIGRGCGGEGTVPENPSPHRWAAASPFAAVEAAQPAASRSPDRTGVCCAGEVRPHSVKWQPGRVSHRQISPIKSRPQPIVTVQGRIRGRMAIVLPLSATPGVIGGSRLHEPRLCSRQPLS